MNQEYFQQLRHELHGHPFRDRFLEELEDHAEDLMKDKKIKDNISESYIKEKLGDPKEIKRNLNYILNPGLKVWAVTLYSFSLYGLFFTWAIIFNALLVPWDGYTSEGRPAIGTWERSLNDFFEIGAGSIVTPVIIFLLLGISILFVILRIRKKGFHSIFSAIEYAGFLNFLYLGILFAITLFYVILAPNKGIHGFNFIALIVHLIGIICLFYMQYTGFTLNKNLKS